MTDALLFDLGGVIMEIDRMRAVEAFGAMGMSDADGFFDPYLQRGLFGRLEEGLISAEEFRREVRPLFGRPASDAEIDAGLCRFLIGIPPERLERLAALRRKGYQVCMLSNTNPIMWEEFILPEFRKEGGDVNDYFDGIVTSFGARCCKPDRRIFDHACEAMGLEPSRTLFFDDGPANIEAARKLGFKTALVAPQNDFMALTGRLL